MMNRIAALPFGSQLSYAWQIFRHELLYILWALMELSIIVPFSLALMPWARYWSPTQVVLWLLLIMLIPFNLSRFASILDIPVQRQQVIMAVALLLTVVLNWRILVYPDYGLLEFGWLGEIFGHITEAGNPYRAREFALFALIVICWWRGISLVGRRIDFRDTGSRFRFEILLVAVFVAGIAGTLLSWSVTPFILLFIFTSLLAVILARIEQLEMNRSGQSFPMGPRWLLVVVSAAGLLTFITGILTGYISGDSVKEVVGWLGPIWGGIVFLTAVVASMISYMIVPIILFLEWLIGLLPFDFSTPDDFALDFGFDEAVATLQPEELVEQAPQIVETSQRLLPILIMVFIILLVSLVLGRLFRMARRTAEPEASSISALDGITGLEAPGFGQRLLDRLGFVRRWRSATSIRRIYKAMADTAADFGYPRSESETPYEYLATLSKAWPNQKKNTEIITEAYIHVRYGEIPENKEEMDRIVNAWDELRADEPDDVSTDDSAMDLQRKL